jgi:hypothetical protein
MADSEAVAQQGVLGSERGRGECHDQPEFEQQAHGSILPWMRDGG